MLKQDIFDVSSLEEKHVISILVFLNERGSTKKMDIYNCISTNPRIPDKLERLEMMGLITQVNDTSSKSIIVSLTDKGARVSSYLRDVDRVIKEK